MSNSVSLIFQHFPDLSEKQKDQFAQLEALYTEWNAKINVVSRKDIEALYEKHVLHSLGIAKVIQFKAGSSILDVGTGGGFPGIPLAILFPDCQFHLVDSIGKKIKVVQAIADSLGLSNLKASHSRAEDIEEKFDFVVSRAVTRMAPFFKWISKKFKNTSNNDLKNGILYLKGGDLKEELAELGMPYKLHELSQFFDGEFFETKKVVYIAVKS